MTTIGMRCTTFATRAFHSATALKYNTRYAGGTLLQPKKPRPFMTARSLLLSAGHSYLPIPLSDSYSVPTYMLLTPRWYIRRYKDIPIGDRTSGPSIFQHLTGHLGTTYQDLGQQAPVPAACAYRVHHVEHYVPL